MMAQNKFQLLILCILFFSHDLLAQSPWATTGEIVTPPHFRVWSDKIAPDHSIWVVSTRDASSLTDQIPQVHRSVDEGATWITSEIEDAQGYPAWDISPIDSMKAYIATDAGGLFQTMDGGQQWQKVNSYPYTCWAVHFFNENEGWVYGSDTNYVDVMSLTADGGETWTHIGGTDWNQPPGTSLPPEDTNEYVIPATFSVNSAYDYQGESLILGTNTGKYWLSKDKGYNWTRHDTPLSDLGFLTSNITMKDEQTIMVAGDKDATTYNGVYTVTFITTDGGTTWIDGYPPLTAAASHYIPGTDGTFIMVGHHDYGWGGQGTAITYDYGENWEMIHYVSLISIDFLDDIGVGACCNNSWQSANGQINLWQPLVPVSELFSSHSIRLFPNPVSDVLTVEIDEVEGGGNLQIGVYTMSGQMLITTEQPLMNEVRLDVNHLPKGIYLFKLVSDDKFVARKFIKN